MFVCGSEYACIHVTFDVSSNIFYADVRGNNTWLMFLPLAPVKASSTSLLVLAFITILICLISLLMLLHLILFHFYLREFQLQY